MGKALIRKADLAKRAGVSRAAIDKVCKSKPEGKLYKAMVDKLVDLDHPAVVEYIKLKQSGKTSTGVKNAKSAKPAKSKSVKKTTTQTSEASEEKPANTSAPKSTRGQYSKDKDIKKVMDWSLRDIIKEFGTDIKFDIWAKAVKTISDTRYKDLKNAELEGSLILRALVKTHIFGAIESSHLRLLTDTPKTISRRVFALAAAGEPIENAELLVRELIAIQLKNTKKTAQRVLSNATTTT